MYVLAMYYKGGYC